MSTDASPACRLRMRAIRLDRAESVVVQVNHAVIAGWTGRDAAAMEHHIAELEALGIRRPPRTPMLYRISCRRLTTEAGIEASGSDSSGEVEYVMLQQGGELWIGAGSDHTDRVVEAYDITVSKQMCDKPLAAELWRYADVRGHWDELIVRSYVGAGSARELYQEGTLAALLAPSDLIAAYTGGSDELAEGTLMFGGTVAAIGGVRPAAQFEFELVDPVLDRRIAHHYAIIPLPRAL